MNGPLNRRYGITPRTYASLLNTLYRNLKHTKGGRPFNLQVKVMLEMFLRYIYYNDTFIRLGEDFGISPCCARNIVLRIMSALMKSRLYRVPTADNLKSGNLYIVDTMPVRIRRPKSHKRQKQSYNGKYKYHIVKVQLIVIDGSVVPQAVNVTQCGTVSDIELFRKTISSRYADEELMFIGDKGYQGMQELYKDSLTPIKKPKGGVLSDSEKSFNRCLSAVRIKIEHANSFVKRFKLVGGIYRGDVSRVNAWVRLIFGICRYDLTHAEPA